MMAAFCQGRRVLSLYHTGAFFSRVLEEELFEASLFGGAASNGLSLTSPRYGPGGLVMTVHVSVHSRDAAGARVRSSSGKKVRLGPPQSSK